MKILLRCKRHWLMLMENVLERKFEKMHVQLGAFWQPYCFLYLLCSSAHFSLWFSYYFQLVFPKIHHSKISNFWWKYYPLCFAITRLFLNGIKWFFRLSVASEPFVSACEFHAYLFILIVRNVSPKTRQKQSNFTIFHFEWISQYILDLNVRH